MSLSASIAPHLPFLRRFARALTGSQASGDAYAVATLEAIAANPDATAIEARPREVMFKTFLKVWGSVPVNQKGAQESVDDETGAGMMGAADRTLERLTPWARAVFLLRSVEGFSVGAIADMLDCGTAEIESLVSRAGSEIANQLSTQVLIIEDEPIIAMDLEALVIELGHEVIDTARTHKEAVAAIRKHKPGLVLADIHLADGSSGLEAVNEILTSVNVPVIFVTAYPERLLTGDRPEPTFLITKPFRSETVKAIISQALFFDRRAALVASTEAMG
jgi:DNA-directed RNA polymerase specialized sigma24 family protein/CheY-like chemotaxis protein